jgi:starch-binding outer membrane protein, SusD/RagB family
MKKFINVRLFYGLTTLLLIVTACKKHLNQTPKYGLNAEVVYSDPNNYINVLAKLYSGLSMTGIQGPDGKGDIAGINEGFSAYIRVLYNLQEVPTDLAVCGWNDPGIPELNKMEWSAENSFVKGMYFRIYYQLAICNEFIRESSAEKLTERGFSDADKSRIAFYNAEARFLRALSYYHALDLFGNVPFVDESDKVGSYSPKRITRAELFNYIESELKSVENLLLNPLAAPYGRASAAAAQTLLAKLYLNAEVYTANPRYVECANYCEKVINSNAFQIDSEYRNLFLADNHTSNEIIFPVVYDGIYAQTWGGTTFLICASIGGSMQPSQFGVNGGWFGLRTTAPFVDMFTDSMLDGRYLFHRAGQTKNITNLSTFTQGYAIAKFRNVTSQGLNGSNNGQTSHVDTDFPMFRLADVYLMYAEAALRGGGSVGQGLFYMNQLRERAYGNSDFNFSSITLEDVLEERAKELYWECTRRTDLIRYGLFTGGQYVWPFKGGTVDGGATASFLNLYPIPTSDLILNENLIQNPGY